MLPISARAGLFDVDGDGGFNTLVINSRNFRKGSLAFFIYFLRTMYSTNYDSYNCFYVPVRGKDNFSACQVDSMFECTPLWHCLQTALSDLLFGVCIKNLKICHRISSRH